MEATTIHLHTDLIARCRVGDREAHYQLYKLYARAMYNVGYRIIGDRDEAADVLQEAFISAFRSLDHYRGESTFGAWLKRIVVNKAINALHKRRHEAMPDDERWDIPAEEEAEEYADPLTVERVKTAIHQLPDGYRSVLSLYLLEGYDHQEIAEIMQISESTSKSQLNRAKSKLKEILAHPTPSTQSAKPPRS
ncbi:RNA polymerase sigma factor [Parachryseolinea silvisoli]|uniref:RNA polymerase sigma factor n=1 Tax=Parachryseolinea silvisoli TaxID=2873601 RepID=UPI002265CB70|nr:RNA polymerase sigma factor [Parachryseolinea silvisoli]MCD9017370.1 RNA polymerase sigma factor [Parachryseolinea silvisoli]